MIVLIGDVHGSLNILLDIMAIKPEGTTFIQVGDFGVGFRDIDFHNPSSRLPKVERMLKLKKQTMYVCRGNHDDPSYFDGSFMDGSLKFVPDYTVLEIEGKRVLFIGGAISLDRTQRTRYVSYWPKEHVVFKQSELEKIEGNLDLVITHTAPDFCNPIGINAFVKSWINHDPSLAHELPAERLLLTDIYKYLTKEKGIKIKKWIYGHFHAILGTQVKYKTKFRQLNVNEIIIDSVI